MNCSHPSDSSRSNSSCPLLSSARRTVSCSSERHTRLCNRFARAAVAGECENDISNHVKTKLLLVLYHDHYHCHCKRHHHQRHQRHHHHHHHQWRSTNQTLPPPPHTHTHIHTPPPPHPPTNTNTQHPHTHTRTYKSILLKTACVSAKHTKLDSVEPSLVQVLHVAFVVDQLGHFLSTRAAVLIEPHPELLRVSVVDQSLHVGELVVDSRGAVDVVLGPVDTLPTPFPAFVDADTVVPASSVIIGVSIAQHA
jgi:hypothetical protein